MALDLEVLRGDLFACPTLYLKHYDFYIILLKNYNTKEVHANQSHSLLANISKLTIRHQLLTFLDFCIDYKAEARFIDLIVLIHITIKMS